jgi:hypothetical protein
MEGVLDFIHVWTYVCTYRCTYASHVVCIDVHGLRSYPHVAKQHTKLNSSNAF